MVSAREAALAFVAGKRGGRDRPAGRGDLRRADGRADLVRHPGAGPAAPRRRAAGLAGDRHPGRAGLDHRPPARPDRRAGHGRRGRRRASTPGGWSASRCTARPRRRRCARWPTGRGSTWTGARPTATRSTTCRCCPPVGSAVAVNPDIGAADEAPGPRLGGPRLPHRPQGGEGRGSPPLSGPVRSPPAPPPASSCCAGADHDGGPAPGRPPVVMTVAGPRRAGHRVTVRRAGAPAPAARRTGASWSSAPSTCTRGRSRSSQAGSHQFARPSSCITAGTSSIRTTVASMRIAAAMPTPITLRKTRARDERGEHRDHDRRRGGDDPAGAGQALDDARRCRRCAASARASG